MADEELPRQPVLLGHLGHRAGREAGLGEHLQPRLPGEQAQHVGVVRHAHRAVGRADQEGVVGRRRGRAGLDGVGPGQVAQPAPVVAVGAAVLIVASLALTGGGLTLVPGVFLLGAALTRYGIVQSIGRSRGGSVVALLAFTVASIPLTIWQAGDIRMSGFDLASGLAGFAMAGAYIALLSLLMTTRAARGLQAIAIVDLALEDDGGAVSAAEATAREAALRPLARAGRRALVAACSPEVWPPS